MERREEHPSGCSACGSAATVSGSWAARQSPLSALDRGPRQGEWGEVRACPDVEEGSARLQCGERLARSRLNCGGSGDQVLDPGKRS